jgi:hypothetical protein
MVNLSAMLKWGAQALSLLFYVEKPRSRRRKHLKPCAYDGLVVHRRDILIYKMATL